VSCRRGRTIDLLPTIAAFAGAPVDHAVDGVDARGWLTGDAGEERAHEALYFYYLRNQLQAVRAGRYKLHFPHRYRTLSGRAGGGGGEPVRYDHLTTGLELYDLYTDPGETRDLAEERPEVVGRLTRLAERARVDMGDALTEREGANVRAPGRVP